METVRFKKSGGPITVNINCGYAQPGSYVLILWEANSNSVVFKKEGNFINDEDDVFVLPTPINKNDGRILDLGAKLMIIPSITDYHVEINITQDGNTIGNLSQTGNSTGQFVTVQIFAQLMGD